MQELEITIKGIWSEKLKEREKFILLNECKIKCDLELRINQLIEEQLNKYSGDGKRVIRYLFMCRLRSGGYTGNYELIVGISNSKLYMDEYKSMEFWYPELIYKGIEQDLNEIKKNLNKSVFRLEEYEFFCLKQKLLEDYWKIIKINCKRWKTSLLGTLTNNSLMLDQNVSILVGNYMDRLKEL